MAGIPESVADPDGLHRDDLPKLRSQRVRRAGQDTRPGRSPAGAVAPGEGLEQAARSAENQQPVSEHCGLEVLEPLALPGAILENLSAPKPTILSLLSWGEGRPKEFYRPGDLLICSRNRLMVPEFRFDHC